MCMYFFFRTVKIPFQIHSPVFLMLIARKLSSLNINGRDMSVRFPDAFNKAVEGIVTVRLTVLALRR